MTQSSFVVRTIRGLVATCIASTLMACANNADPAAPDTGKPAQELTALPRALSPAERDIRDAANRFAFAMFQKVNAATPNGNTFISPLSISMSLGMAMNGAGGATRDEMRATLGFTTSDMTAINQGYRDLSALLRGLDSATAFQIANSIWYDQRYPFLPGFLQTGRTYFDAEIRGVDFGDAAGTKKLVNDWVSARTNARIPSIVDEVKADDVMYLINAIWFKGNWRARFPVAETRDAPFRAADGTTQPAKLMHRRSDSTMKFRHFADGSVEAGELPYGNGAYAMTVVLPPEGTSIDAFAASLTPARWDAIVGAMQVRNGVDVYLPRFTLTFERELANDLKALGMRQAFDPGAADMSGMTSRNDLYVRFVMHKTFVKVDEEGTEAAAVTNTGIGVTSLPPSFRVDRPFVFAIRERLSGTVLFIGKMAKLP